LKAALESENAILEHKAKPGAVNCTPG